jgi:hypothetical protein
MLGTMEDATYGLTFRREGDGLRATVSGKRTFDNTLAYWQGIVAQIEAKRPRWLYVSDHLQGPELQIGDWLMLVSSMQGRGLEGMRIAHVRVGGMDHLEYCEIFAREAGIDARAFNDPGVAERWLRYGVDDAA